MANKPSLKSVNRLRFLHNNNERERRIAAAPETPLPKDYPVNELSRALHPDRQYVKIAAIKTWDDNCKSFTFAPDPARGTEHLAFFKAGSYLSVFLDVDGMKLTRPYSISSSPAEALDGRVTLTIKRVPGGIASNYMLDHWQVGDEVTLTGPLGEFVYTILQSLEKHGIAAPAHCRSGECGWCHSLLLSGEVYCPKHLEHRREADLDFGYIHPCCTFPLSDIAVEVPYAK